MAVDYLTTADLRAYLGLDIDPDRDALLADAITSACRWIDDACGRRFWQDDTATVKTIRTRRRTLVDGEEFALLVPDISVETGLVLTHGVSSLDFWGEPDVTPIISLYSKSAWPEPTVDITARWGWPVIPDAIVRASTILAARLYRRKDSPEGVLGSAEWGLVRVGRVDPDVAGLIAPYVAPGFA